MNSPNSQSSASSTNMHSDLIKRKKGTVWEGDEMEMQHFRDHQEQNLFDKKNKKTSNFTAVDISQFQNHQIGQGYQAKHVIRQKNNEGLKLNLDVLKETTTKHLSLMEKRQHKDEKKITSRKDREKSRRRKYKENSYSDSNDERHIKKKTKKKRKRHSRRDRNDYEDKYSDSDTSNEPIIENDVNIYLKCQPLRRFRIELEQLLQENVKASKYK